MLNPNFRFDTFTVAPNNRFAYVAATVVADQPGRTYNPLLLYGETGLGKTHLLHAIGNRALLLRPGTAIVYSTGAGFAEELHAAVQMNQREGFIKCYGRADLLLLDAIEGIAGDEAAATGLLHAFDALYAAGKQLAIGSNHHPSSLFALATGLRNRLAWGLLAEIRRGNTPVQ